MKRLNIEFLVGLFLLLGMAAFFYLAVKMGDVGLWRQDGYAVTARFTSSSGLKEGAMVELAGVRVGKVRGIALDPERYESVVTLAIEAGVQITEDTIASVRTAGIIGDKFIKLTPGGLDDYLADGDEIIDTESSLDIEELVSKYIFESGDKPPVD
jgi:phospholipid/cholesterol/gamma-HCH transport system substrate-binding protein